MGTILTLVWLCVAENRWASPRDCDIEWHLVARYADAKHVSIPIATRKLVWRFSRPPAWIRRIRPGCYKPRGFPWTFPHASCKDLFERAALFLDGHISDPCPEVRQWRAPGAKLPKGYVRADCGRTINVYVK